MSVSVKETAVVSGDVVVKETVPYTQAEKAVNRYAEEMSTGELDCWEES